MKKWTLSFVAVLSLFLIGVLVYQYTPNFLEEIVLWDILEEGQIENLPDEEETDETGEVTDPTSDIADSDENEDAKADREDTDETPSLEVELPTSEELPTLQEEVVQQNRVEVMNSTNPVVTLVWSGEMTIEVYGNFIDPGANWTDTDGGSGQIFPERGSIDWYTSSNEMLVKLDALNKDGLGDGERDSAQVNIWKNLAPDTTSAGNTDFNLSNVIDNTSSLYMNGTNSNIVSSAPLSFTGHDSLSVEIVFKPENITAVGMLFENGTAWNSSDGGFGAVYNTTSSGAPDGLGIVHTNYNASPSRASFPANYAWNNTSTYQTHTNIYTIVADPDGRQVYIGGEKKTLIPTSSSTGTLSGATPGGGTFGSAPLNFFIGSRADSGFRVKGEILALRIYGKKLSASEVCQNAWADYYRFDTGVAPSCTDPFDIAINGTVDTNIIGEYVLTYIKVDSTGNIGKAYRTVYVVDTTPPVLTINTGTDSIDMYSGRTDAGAEWSDNYDTGTGIVYAYSGTVNTGVAGSYQVDYCRVDTNGNTGYTSRTVIVQDTELPMITLSGANPQYIEVNTAYVELGASVQDNYDTGLIATIDASEVNTSVLWTYYVYYTAQDSNGNKALTGERTVIVQKTLIPITPPITSGGGGGKSLAKDNCPDGDFSSSYYDNTCDSSPLRGGEVNQEHNVAEEKSLYKTAYEWGNDYGITTVSIYEEARISDAILRQEMAKMISTYAIKLLNKTPDPDKVACAQFQDVSEVPTELQPYIIQSCELGLMGMDGDGVGIQENFFPKNSITRAEVGTILSRLLRGTTYATQEGDETYYTRHLQALKKAGIMNFISNPEMLELRGNILLMLWKSVTWK